MTQTHYWTVGPAGDPGLPAIREAATLLRQGELVAFPTETVYGLGADARNTAAVAAIFAAKGRPSDNPLIVHIADRSQLTDLVERPDETAERLMDAFWPGPLTIVLPVLPGAVSPLVTAGLATVGVRMPAHPVALGLLAAAGCPVAAPSANRSGRPSPTQAAHVRADLDGAIAGIVDGGATGVGLESTVVAVEDGAVRILRPGGVTAEQLRAALPAGTAVLAGAEAAADAAEAPRAPGMKYRHYAPRGSMAIVAGDDADAVSRTIQRRLDQAKQEGERTGVLTCEEHAHRYRADVVAVCGRLAEPDSIARGLFAALRRFDDEGAAFLLAEPFGQGGQGIGAAVWNRLRKAAEGRIVSADEACGSENAGP
ncbi:MAG: threonylcarbamoyl-AMP synthase [Paenibacillaceae bacterium]|nr:threonylcarbamoyl-AMP synthase [Paenibacillaceae bacterium]